MSDPIQQIVTICSKQAKVSKVTLFGSRARGDANPRSDIDIAIDCPTLPEKDWVWLRDALDDIDTLLEVDIVRFDTAPKALQDHILQEGKILYERH